MNIPLCDFEGAQWLIFNPNVAPLVYYSHLPILVVSVVLAFFILFKGAKKLPNQILFFTLFSFATWVLLDSIFWASNRSDVIMLAWSLILLFEPLVYIGCFYLLYVLTANRDLSFWVKCFFFVLFIPLIVFVPTKYGLSDFDLASCLAIEGPIALYYTYFVEILTTLIIATYAFYKMIKAPRGSKREIFFLLTGILLLLGAFAWGNITGSFTENWQLGQFGLFGMPLFAGFLVYSIVRFKTFNIKLIAAQALVVFLWVLIPSLLLVQDLNNIRIIVVITSVLIFVLGIYLIRSVKREVEQREKIEKLEKEVERSLEIEKKANEELEKLDKVKNQFLAQTQHDLRTPLTSIMGYTDLMLAGTFGKQTKKTTDVVQKLKGLADGMIKKANNFLDLAQFQLGKSQLKLEPGVSMVTMLEEIKSELDFKADTKHISLTLEKPEHDVLVSADREKLKAALFNIVDNSVKYTQQGGVTISVKSEARNPKSETNLKLEILVVDTGIGLDPQKAKTMFDEMFERSEQAKKVATGAGIGLYLSTQIIKAHKGKVWAESEGEGKGSIFHIELPMN